MNLRGERNSKLVNVIKPLAPCSPAALPASCDGPFQGHPIGAYRHDTSRSSHSSAMCFSSTARASSREQKRHLSGSSRTAFSTARLRLQTSLEMTQRQFGHVAVSSRMRASASK